MISKINKIVGEVVTKYRLSMKNKDETISEISINMESLENILTTC